MASIDNFNRYNHFNNLLYNTRRIAKANMMEHLAARIPLDLRPTRPAPIDRVLNAGAQQINGKHGDIKYVPFMQKSRPDYSYDARIDPTILNATRNNFVDVSGTLIAAKNLPKNKYDMNMTVRPLKPYGIVQ